MNLAAAIKKAAIELGFDAVGITDASPVSTEDSLHLHRWLEDGKAAGMAFMHRNIEKRLDPGKLLTGARSVICVALSYKLPPQNATSSDTIGIIAEYAVFKDYHIVIKERLNALAAAIEAKVGRKFTFKACVDSAPIAERVLAARAGLGFIGKNRMLINPVLGPSVWLGELVTDLELERDHAASGSCGTCRACLDACPTGALATDSLDARKCISYLTIEHKGEIPREYAAKIGQRLFGCDECTLACPFYKNAPPCSSSTQKLLTCSRFTVLSEVLQWDETTYRNKTTGTPLERPGLAGFVRNAAICVGNSRLR